MEMMHFTLMANYRIDLKEREKEKILVIWLSMGPVDYGFGS